MRQQQKQRFDKIELRQLRKRAARYDHFLVMQAIAPEPVKEWTSIISAMNFNAYLERVQK